jgi:hypothetical protein
MLASGVFSSWDMWRRNRLRSCARSEQAQAQPFELRAEALQVARARDFDRAEKVPRPSSLMARSMARNGRPMDSVSARMAMSVSGASSADARTALLRARGLVLQFVERRRSAGCRWRRWNWRGR